MDMADAGMMMDMTMPSTTNGDDMGGMGDMGDMDTSSMKMYFHGGYSDYLLFEDWYIDEAWKLAVAFIGMFILSILYEGLKYFREYLYRKESAKSLSSRSVDNYRGDFGGHQEPVSVWSKMFNVPHAIQTVLHLVQVFLTYVIMLVVMTYNVYLMLAVVVGSACGYFLFGWLAPRGHAELSDHCH